jgi:hypothetical protein
MLAVFADPPRRLRLLAVHGIPATPLSRGRRSDGPRR